MNEIKVFENQEVRISVLNDNPYFCLKDVCAILDIKNPRDCKERLNQDGVATTDIIDSMGRTQEATFINESNLYKVVFQSRKPEAEKFTDWVTSEVLPSIRKNGGYIQNQESMTDEELMAKALEVASKVIKQKELMIKCQEQKIKELQPQADYTNQILKSTSLVTITQIAKDYGFGGATMNKLLNERHVQYKRSGQWLLYDHIQDKGYTSSETVTIEKNDGTSMVKMTTKWTQKGRLFIYNLLKKDGILPKIEQTKEERKCKESAMIC